jgi:hypothetical protein
MEVMECSVSAVCACIMWRGSWLSQEVVHLRSVGPRSKRFFVHTLHKVPVVDQTGKEEHQRRTRVYKYSCRTRCSRAIGRLAQRGLLVEVAQNRRRLCRVAAQHIQAATQDPLLKVGVAEKGSGD